MPSAYDVLRAREDATEEELVRAYKHALAKAHPDKHGGDERPAQVVNRAWGLVGTPVKRAEYDARLRRSRAAAPAPAPAPASSPQVSIGPEFVGELFKVGVAHVAERLGPEGSEALGRIVGGVLDLKKATGR